MTLALTVNMCLLPPLLAGDEGAVPEGQQQEGGSKSLDTRLKGCIAKGEAIKEAVEGEQHMVIISRNLNVFHILSTSWLVRQCYL